jgi:methylmalonyl-CoA mutase N-terminal domain/subunit
MKGRQNMTELKAPESATQRAPLLSSEEASSHIPVRPLYTPSDLAAWDYQRDAGYPGEFPYTRGVQATMYRGRLWTMRQYAGMGDAEESNKRYKYLLANGTTGLSVAFDLPTQIGLDSAAVRWHRPDRDFNIDDHQCDGVDSAGAIRSRGEAAR